MGLPLLGMAPLPRPRILVLGDSVSWGQGLRETQKMHSLLARMLHSRDGIEPTTHLYAVSGALIGEAGAPKPVEPWWPREIPRDDPTLHDQCGQVLADHPDRRFDVIIIAGGINDVNVRTIFNPTTKPDDIRKLCDTYCDQRMGRLLERVRTDFVSANPEVKVLVLGYYSVFSADTDAKLLKEVVKALIRETVRPPSLAARGGTSPEDWLKTRMVENGQTFRDASLAALGSAVARANGVGGGTFKLIDPKITDREAALAPDALIFGVDHQGEAQDDLKEDRVKYCGRLLKVKRGLPRFTCIRASVGHPNKPGAVRYAQKLLEVV